MAKRKPNRGSFKPGHPGGPGRPPRAREQQYLEATIAVVTLARWRKVIARALKDAEGGDAKARDFLAQYLVPPTSRIDLQVAGSSDLAKALGET